jgi:protein gp37
MLNKQGPEKIDFCDFTWNPISGCLGPDGDGKHCPYCHLKRMEKRYQRGMMEPMFHADRMIDIEKAKLPSGSKIFVGSSGDMFGAWMESTAIIKILEVCAEHPELIFQFLTKNPIRYKDFFFPHNCWLGTTIEEYGRKQVKRYSDYCEAIQYNQNNIHFVSMEPLLSEHMTGFVDIFDWIIIGANSNPGAERPAIYWATEIIHEARRLGKPVWVKNNFKYPERIKEWPEEKHEFL